VVAQPRFEPSRAAPDLRLADADEGGVQLSRTAITAGALVAGVILIGALAGLEAGRSEEPQPAEAAVTAALPAPKPVAASVTPAPVLPRAVNERQAAGTSRAPVAAARVARPTAPNAQARLERFAASIQSEIAPAAAELTEQASADSPAVETAAAMPLPNSVVARTIDRIGYSCGSVASTSAIEGAQGAFTVTCTSGQSYRAAPVRGRYHFRKIH
jgi:hypothetical protein